MSAVISQTLQGAMLGVISNVLAQVISAFKNNTSFAFNPVPVLRFFMYGILNNPPNILWQNFLEEKFPNYPATPESEKPNKKPTKTIKVANVVKKFALDQTIGAAVNTVLFLAFMAYTDPAANGKTNQWEIVRNEVQDKFWPMIKDGAKLWTPFSIISFLWIPVDKRIVAGCAVGIFWGIYLSLMVDS